MKELVVIVKAPDPQALPTSPGNSMTVGYKIQIDSGDWFGEIIYTPPETDIQTLAVLIHRAATRALEFDAEIQRNGGPA